MAPAPHRPKPSTPRRTASAARATVRGSPARVRAEPLVGRTQELQTRRPPLVHWHNDPPSEARFGTGVEGVHGRVPAAGVVVGGGLAGRLWRWRRRTRCGGADARRCARTGAGP